MTLARTDHRVAYELDQFTLPNGLRVVVSPDRRAPVVGLSVCYDVGTRSEPPGRAGFAHLFEHLMFQGSVHLPKLAHINQVQGSGGACNATTHPDYTEFYETLPVGGLERALFLEADRMRGLALTAESLANQVDVVKQEIRGTVSSRPYGGFPHTDMASLIFDTFPNAHDGYGSFTDLESATLADAEQFFGRYYPPGSAVLAIAGDIAPDHARALVAHHFGDLPPRPVPPLPGWSEPDLAAEREHRYADVLAPLLAFACGWRVPDPVDELPELLPYLVLVDLLATGDLSRLTERMVVRDRSAMWVSGQVGLTGEWYTSRGPCVLVLQATLPPGGSVPAARDTVQEELARMAAHGPTTSELARAQSVLAAGLLRELDPVLNRARWLAPVRQQRGDAGELADLPARLAEVSADQVAAAAGQLIPRRRATVVVEPGGRP